MRKTPIALALAMLFATSAMADGKITFVNHANGAIKVWAYDWDDIARTISRSQTTIGTGSTGSVTCKKNWSDSNAPGCYVTIHTKSYDEEIVSQVKYRNGSYEVKGSWRYTGQPPITFDTHPTISQLEGSEKNQLPEVSEVAIQKGRLPKPGGGTTDCIYKGPEAVLANNGIATLQWRSDGNLVLFDRQGIQWITGTDSDAAKMCFQGDGNLVIYRKNHGPWATGTDGHGVALKLQRDCNIVIQDASGKTLWQAGTVCRL